MTEPHYYLHWPSSETMKQAGYGTVAHVPCVFDKNWAYVDEASRYLRERALLEWTPAGQVDDNIEDAGTSRYPTRKSLQNYGERLTNFLEWCEFRNLAWREVHYTDHLIDRYQAEMRNGAWSERHRPLAPRTINARVDEACYFLRWAASHGYRGPFKVVSTLKRKKAGSATHSTQRTVTVKVRAGKVRPNPAELRIPTPEEMKRWHRAVLVRKGYTKALMCRLTCETALRISEVVNWEYETLPLNPDEWKVVGDIVEVTISKGVKGTKSDGPGGNEGRPRVIEMPLKLAQELHRYRMEFRPSIRRKWINAAATPAEKMARASKAHGRLFLSEFNGEPVTQDRFWEAWKKSGYLPYPEWHPHLGRHYWACSTLLKEAEAQREFVMKHGKHLPMDWITGITASTLLMKVQPQLGHLDPETTQTYLKWTHQLLKLQIDQDYADYLDAAWDVEDCREA
ncbi:tyrosine-type recombinase/integrase [Azohydromonas australica]|uniref:tyrosine-type recombinase/integrase n=1 Tax=Azohydromonas australica TaxID=364039 RepID=UPI00146AA77E|nr:site-specific integrase [Azohydromonas australica]